MKNPLPGKVKTRLAATLGDEAALAAYLLLLQYTHDTVAGCAAQKLVCYSDEIESADLWENHLFGKTVQRGADLGVRMENAFAGAFASGAERVVIIGSDCAELKTEHLEQAFEALHSHDLVLGPAEDGGYYLLGLSRMVADVFRNKEWSTDRVAAETLRDAERLGLSVFMLPVLCDIDTEEDWRKCHLCGGGLGT